MKCPNCKYEDGWSNEELKMIPGNEGEFYQLPTDVSRKSAYGRDYEEHLYACPKCGIAFINI